MTSLLSGRRTRKSSSRKLWSVWCLRGHIPDGSNEFLQAGTVKRILTDPDSKVMGTVELEARYIPVPLKLEPRESINSKQNIGIFLDLSDLPLDQGTFQVQLLNGGEIHAADRSGLSSPFEFHSP